MSSLDLEEFGNESLARFAAVSSGRLWTVLAAVRA
jgi:hypothetical protein